MSSIQAVLWDVDGTLAETERDGHRVAFNQAFQSCGLPWRWDDARYGELLRITGGRERLLHDMATRSDAPVLATERQALARELHERKNAFYADRVASGAVGLRAGVPELMCECRASGLRMGIATTTSRANVEALLHAGLGARWAEWFDVLVCGEDVRQKKPDPEVYLRALAELRIAPPAVVAIEDSPGGAAAARAANCPVVLTRSVYFHDAPIDGAIAIGPGLHTRGGWRPALDGAAGPVRLEDLIAWHAQMETVSTF